MIYSIPRMLFGLEKISGDTDKASTALLLARGKDFPFFKWKLSKCRYSSVSSVISCAYWYSKPISPHSLPKWSTSVTPSLSRSVTAPLAKYSALPSAKYTGSSNTASAPQESAMRQRAYLSTMAGSPLCTKSPLRTTMI